MDSPDAWTPPSPHDGTMPIIAPSGAGRSIAAVMLATVAVAVTVAAAVVSGGATVSSAAPPAGYVQLVDDTQTIRLTVPASWTDVDLTPIVDADGTPHPHIAASPSLQSFADTFDVPGALFAALPYTTDPHGVIESSGLTGGCTSITIEPYSDPVFTGFVQVGTGCGSGAATWRMVVANPHGNAFTAMVQVQAATAADQPALDIVLGSFDTATPTTVPDVTAPAAPPTTVLAEAQPTTSTILAASSGASSTDQATPPPAGSVRLYDDTGTVTVVVPEAWSDVETNTLLTDGGTRRIAASPDLDAMGWDEDGAGVMFFVQPFTDDLESLLNGFDRPDSCATSGIQPYSDNAGLAGLIWLGQQCGPSQQGTWLVVVASPADQAVTFRVHARTASAADEPAVDTVLQTFDLAGPTVPAAQLGPAPLPTDATAVEVATTFLAALAAGDGATACSLLSPDYIANFAGGIRNCAADLGGDVAGQGAFWTSVVVAGDEQTASESCGDEGEEGITSLELQGPIDTGCLSMGRLPTGEWRIEDLSNSIWNQA